MSDRRPLIDGLKSPPKPVSPIDPQREREFVHGANATPLPEPHADSGPVKRVAISTRMRKDFATALKRASLERQLNDLQPSTLQDILEQAVEPWLKANGYIG